MFFTRKAESSCRRLSGIEAANKEMQLKTRRDFLDCDLYHIACFGWFGADVTVLTCDPPDSIMNRIAVYKGMVESVAANAPTFRKIAFQRFVSESLRGVSRPARSRTFSPCSECQQSSERGLLSQLCIQNPARS
jgi:hypothetical protein